VIAIHSFTEAAQQAMWSQIINIMQLHPDVRLHRQWVVLQRQPKTRQSVHF